MNPAVPFAHWSIYFELPVLIMIISLVYSATRFDRWDFIIREALRWVVRMTLFLVGIVLILTGISLDGSPDMLRWSLSLVGVVLELSLLFIK